MSHNQFPPPQQCREWSDVDPDGWALEFVQQFQELCSLWVSLCVRSRQLMCDRSWTGYAVETPMYDSSFGPRSLVESFRGSSLHFSQDWHNIWCTLDVPFSNQSWKSPQVTYTTPNKRVWKLSTSTQLRATWHTDSLDMVVLPSTGTSRYHHCCIEGGTSPDNFGLHLVWRKRIGYKILCFSSMTSVLNVYPSINTSLFTLGAYW